MVKTLNAFFSGDARGSVGAFTASRNRSGGYMRQKVSPVQRRSQAQQSIRYNLQTLTKQFQNLTATQIAAWNEFASANSVTDVFNNQINLTGMNWYLKLNSRLLEAGFTVITDPPDTGNASFTPVMNATFLSGVGINFSFDTVPSTGQSIWLQWSNNVPLSREFLSADVRQRQRIVNTDTSPETIIPVSDLTLNTSQRQITAFAVDEFGRATPKLRFTVQPTSP